jgi:hypothetical protein
MIITTLLLPLGHIPFNRSGGNQQDLVDRQERHRLIYRLVTISAADSGGARRNKARRRRDDAVARACARMRTRASEGVRPVGLAEATWSGSTR